MALGKKQVVIYGAVAVIVVGALIMGGLAWTGQLKIKAGADMPPGANDMSRWLLPGRWNLVTVPCNSGGTDLVDLVLGSHRAGLLAAYDTGDGYIEGKDIKVNTEGDLLGDRARSYWIKPAAVENNQTWTTCPPPTGDVEVPLKVGSSVPVGNPFNDYLYNTGIKLVVDGKEIPLATGKNAEEDTGALKQNMIQLAFYNAGDGNYNMVDDFDSFLIGPNGSTDLAPFAGFYVAVSPSLGNSQVSLKFLKSYTEENWSVNSNTPPCQDECAATCKAWGEKSEDMLRPHKAFCDARPTP